jgi:hypothetical protein
VIPPGQYRRHAIATPIFGRLLDLRGVRTMMLPTITLYAVATAPLITALRKAYSAQVLGATGWLRSLARQEHGWTIPLADVDRFVHWVRSRNSSRTEPDFTL